MMDIVFACVLILFGTVALAIGIYQLGPIIFGLFMLAGGVWFISMGIYGLDQHAKAKAAPTETQTSR